MRVTTTKSEVRVEISSRVLSYTIINKNSEVLSSVRGSDTAAVGEST